MAKWYEYLLNFIFPLSCVVCQQILKSDNRYYLCSECFGKIKFIKGNYCLICGQPGWAEVCSRCLKNKPDFDFLRACCVYEEPIKGIIHLFKYKNMVFLAGLLGQILIAYLTENVDIRQFNYLVPIPLSKKKVRKRGYNQSLLLAQKIAKCLKIQLIKGNLIKIRETESQVKLAYWERKKNLEGAFKVRDYKIFQDKNIILVDDVWTTGTTMNECAKLVKESGGNKVIGITLAHG